jgi:hypothetical protein
LFFIGVNRAHAESERLNTARMAAERDIFEIISKTS